MYQLTIVSGGYRTTICRKCPDEITYFLTQALRADEYAGFSTDWWIYDMVVGKTVARGYREEGSTWKGRVFLLEEEWRTYE